jgi:hypothetical protein
MFCTGISEMLQNDQLDFPEPTECFVSPPIDPLRGQRARSWHFRKSNECQAMRSAIHAILTNAIIHPKLQPWTVQGFGMLRTYLPFGPNHETLPVEPVERRSCAPRREHDARSSMVVSHSWIINGEFRNLRFVEDSINGDEYEFMKIMCGECGGARSGVESICLGALPVEHYTTGDLYHQDADEIHLSAYDQGTVTLNDRTGDTEHARVFWPAGGHWVDAKPREATQQEIMRTLTLALDKWQDQVKMPL